jgi:hypothetical protein
MAREHSFEMRRNIGRIDFSHTPVRLIVAAPLHAGEKRTGGIVKNAETIGRGEGFRPSGSK